MSFNIPQTAASELDAMGGVDISSTPTKSCISCHCSKINFEPHQDTNIRTALAFAITHEAIFKTAAYSLSAPMSGSTP